jgi:hypothetical protein
MHFTKTLGLFASTLLVGSLLVGCGDSTSNPTDSGVPPVDNPAPTDNPAPSDSTTPGDVDLGPGRMVAESLCRFCHFNNTGSDYGGQTTPRPMSMAYGANLTPDNATGLGSWTYEQFNTAVRNGMDEGGRRLCPTMPRYTTMQVSDEQMRSLYAFFRSQAPVNRMIPASMCP